MKGNLALLSVAFVVVVVNTTPLIDNSEYCYPLSDTDELKSFLARFSTNTPYDAIRGSASNPSTCKPTGFWLLSRHGTRRPTDGEGTFLMDASSTIQRDVIENINAGRTKLCESCANIIKEWKLDLDLLETDGGLSSYGVDEMKNKAKRYQDKFPNLLQNVYTPSKFTFRNSKSERTRDSAVAFAEGLFGKTGSEQVNYTNSGSAPDMLLQSYHQCDIWNDLLKPLGTLNGEAFANGQEFKDLIKRVNDKMGFTTGYKRLTRWDIQSLAIHCMYEQILDRTKPSPWCCAFSLADMLVVEYYQDFVLNYRSGYGFKSYEKLYKNMNCELVKNIINFLSGADNENARLFFGHDLTMHFLYVALGFFKDDVPMTADNFAQQYGRKWRSSLNTSMGATLVIVRYECENGDDEVLIEVNERPLVIENVPGCKSNGICKLSVFLERLSYFANGNCEKRFCTNNSS